MFIARQPIFNKKLDIYGYELLFRATVGAVTFGDASSQAATATVVGGLFEEGIHKIVGNAKAFVNFDYDFIMSDMIELIDPDKLIIEVLETVKVDDRFVKRVYELSKMGYKIALDDFEEKIDTYPIVPISDVIKYDIIVTPLSEIKQEVRMALEENKILLAEKIETEAEYQEALRMGFQLFQGYFFSKPNIVARTEKRLPLSSSFTALLHELKKPQPSFDKLVEIISTDAELVYKLFRIIGREYKDEDIMSIKKALVKMGFKSIERWIHILLLQNFSKDKPSELMELSLIRSKFGEYIALNSKFKNDYDDVNIMCLFSLLDAILDRNIEEALEGIKLSKDVYWGLVNCTGKYAFICKIVSAYEKGDWPKVFEVASKMELKPDILGDGYLNAIKWSASVMSNI